MLMRSVCVKGITAWMGLVVGVCLVRVEVD